MGYVWSAGFRGAKQVDAEVVGQTIEELGGADVCPPELLVDAARPSKSPLHSLFEWNDKAAAEKFRIEQARDVIRHLRVETFNREGEAVRAPAFVHVKLKDDDETVEGYMASSVAMSRVDTRAFVLGEALALLEGILRRYEDLSELSGVRRAVQEVRSRSEGRVSSAKAKAAGKAG